MENIVMDKCFLRLLITFSIFLSASSYAEDFLHWIVIDGDGTKYSTALGACRAGILEKESRHDPAEYDWRVEGDFWSGGTYSYGNMPKMPLDPGFDPSARSLNCQHEYLDLDDPENWKTFSPYSGASIRLIGDICREGLYWSNERLGCFPPPSKAGEGCDMTEKPINIVTGNKFFRTEDYSSAGPFPLRFRRYYNSLNQDSDQLGWSYDYRQSLKLSANLVKALRADGKEVSFYLDGSGLSWQSEYARREQLIALPNGEWELRLRGFRERYNSIGELTSITSPQGLTHVLSYSGNNVEVSHAGRKLVLTLNDAGMISALTTPDLQTISYDYVSGSGVPKLIKVNYPTSSVSYFYQDPRYPLNITRIENDQGQVLSEVTYNELGRATTSGLANGASKTSITYIDADNSYRREVTNALGKTAIHYYSFTDFTPAPGELTVSYPSLTRLEGQASASCAASDSEYTYDTRGFKASFTDSEGNITLYQHDARGNETSRTEASGTSEERTITTQWHADYALPLKITEPDRVTDFLYDSNGYLLNKTVTATAP